MSSKSKLEISSNANLLETNAADEIPKDEPAAYDSAAFLLIEGMPMSFDKLERSIQAYVSTPGAMASAEGLSFQILPIVEATVATVSSSADDAEELGGTGAGTSILAEANQPPKQQVDPAAAVYAIPELAALGRVFRSSSPVDLTESETEYVVRCIKHVLPDHIILQFTVQNN